ncbi:MAG: lipid A biosynthesis acyltransferase [Candidatus Nitricoxidivorans perseverans]|uniref:Lipid A biosynthesis acyltransferase n=1 Tax=Candidatus Nitricoxidivorans perseverans TaxID=2975601 RepID=A0AA49IY42_9PROT|nr:MAG: lipid A biosynthesis acyltransferase [Candidatus Nitricoxidivorans perseverans]
MTRLALILMWLLHWLPLPALAALGRLFGRLLFRFGHERRHVALTNLGLCFTGMSEAEKSVLARRHFEAFGRSFLERGLLWWAPASRIRRLARIEGLERLAALRDRPVILLVPHFVGLDMGWTRLTLELDMVSIYANQKNLLFNSALLLGRTRFGDSLLLSRQEGTRKAIRAMKAGRPFYYLPDMDYGQRDTLFAPFFGVPAATITGLSRLARMSGAAVVPVVTRMEAADGYVVSIGEPWADYPGESIEADTRRMNAFVEAEVLKMPEQYFWLHKRFKTRPPGEKAVY